MRTAFPIALGVVSFSLATLSIVRANNQWSCWHWDHNNIGLTNHASGYWGTINGSEANDWDQATCVSFGGGNEIILDADFYGATGWLGIARILDYDAGACTIIQADALMNRSYLDGASYDENDDRHVSCQEIGHTLGLDHRHGQAQTCMNDGFNVLGIPDFDQHDADLVDAITEGCGGGSSDPCANGGEKGRRKCSDGIDNDGDGCIDGADPDCQ